MEKRTGQEAGISTFHATTVTELLAQMQKYVIEHAVKGDDGVGIVSMQAISSTQEGSYTYTHVEITLTNGIKEQFIIESLNGRGISSITSGQPQENAGFTTTPIIVHYDQGTDREIFTISAKNGADGSATVGYTSLEEMTIFKSEYTRSLVITNSADSSKFALSHFYVLMNIKPIGSDLSSAFMGDLHISGASNIVSGVGTMLSYNGTDKNSKGVYYIHLTQSGAEMIISLIDRYGNVMHTDNWTFISADGYYIAE